MRIFTKDGKYIAIAGGSDQAFEEIASNARLIAAAPDLLHCLTRIIDELPIQRDWLDPSLESVARDTIAKATGDSPLSAASDGRDAE